MKISYSVAWRGRDGSETRLYFTNLESLEQGYKLASEFGWPGHDGARWRYWLSDIRAWFAALRAMD